jgi:hypothetical protein
MKTTKMNVLIFLGIASLASVYAQSKYSGIYNIKAGVRVLVSITKGGHILSVSSDSGGISEELNPAKSTVDSNGKVIGSNSNGLSVTATIAPDFTLKGTAKEPGGTVRISGKRILN